MVSASPSPLRLSVVVPTCHRNDLLALCLDRLAPAVQTIEAAYEVLVTDDGSQTTAQEMVERQYPWATWLSGPRRGPAANRNNGASHARSEWLVFVDDDCLPDPGWLEAFQRACEQQPETDVFEGQTYADREKRSMAEESPVNQSGGCLWSCNMMLRRRLFERLGGFDERFPFAAMEDVDFRQRLLKATSQPCFVPAASVCHPWRLTRGWEPLRRHQFSMALYLALHPEESQRLNSYYYLRALLRRLRYQTLPGLVRYRGAGLRQELRNHWVCLEMAWWLFRASGQAGYVRLAQELAGRLRLPGAYRLPQWSMGVD